MQAFILISTDPAKAWEVADLALKIEGVKIAHAVTGPFDVVAYAEFTKMDALREILEKIHLVKGVIRTQTAIAMPPRLKV